MFYPQICKHQDLYVADTVDVVFDTYKEQSLNTITRVKRGTGVRRKVQENSMATTNWKGFLRLDQNKAKLFCFLSKTVISFGREDEMLVCAHDDTCIRSNGDLDLSNIRPCNHEEADTRVFLQVKDMAKQGHRKMVIQTVDTDVLVLAVSVFEELQDSIEELWVDFGTGKDRKFVPIHKTFQRIGELKARGLPFFHAFTGCDQVSFLSHVTKHCLESMGSL